MDIVAERCAGLDIGKNDLKACVRTPQRPKRGVVRTFSTTTTGLLALREWLSEEKVTLVGMESTGNYWKPVYYLLEDDFETWLLNAHHMKAVPGRKTDVNDAQWITQLLAHGLVRPSFVPPPPIRALRDLTRYRTALTRERTKEIQRLHDVLQDAGIKLSSVASDIMGRSGRAMLQALVDGEDDPTVLAELALARMRKKIPALTEALTGHFTDHHARMVAIMLGHIDALSGNIAELDTQIEEQMRPFRRTAQALCTIPGVSTGVAEVIIAETGADMTRFPTPGHLASWAGMCPGNNESAGRHKSGRTRKGDSWLRGGLGQAAASASRCPDTYLAAQYRRLASRRGKQRALVAVGHSILETAWHLMANPDSTYQDLGAGYFDTRALDPRRKAERLARHIQALGYTCTITKAA